jgi:hypothetical protein
MSEENNMITNSSTKLAILTTLTSYFEGNIARHKMNINVMLNNPLAIHDHTDYIGAIEKELQAIAEYEDKLAVLKKHFKQYEYDLRDE